MKKSEELSNPNSCLNRAKDDEMLFVLLGRDAAAPAAVREWVRKRIRLGKNKLQDPQIQSAILWAEEVEMKQEGVMSEKKVGPHQQTIDPQDVPQ